MTLDPSSFAFALDRDSYSHPAVICSMRDAKGQTVTLTMAADTAGDVGTLLLAHAYQIRSV